MADTFRVDGLVLKQHKVGEEDTLVTLLTQEQGKIMVRAKGNRKLTSHKRASLEIGNFISAYCIQTKSMPLMTQAKLLRSCRESLQPTLAHHRKLQQILEFFDKLFVEEELAVDVFAQVQAIYDQTLTKPDSHVGIVAQFDTLLVHLGYQPLAETPYANLNEYVSTLAEKPLHAYEFLHVGS